MKKGFTLIELLVVMAILSILTILAAGGYRTAQMRGRDAQRKADLREIANSLELFMSDHGRYPPESSGNIASCAYNPGDGSGSSCAWGSDKMTDGKTVYFRILPEDPHSGYIYKYKVLGSNQKFQLFARLENPEDQDCLNDNCDDPVTITCRGSEFCNFAVTSSNATPFE